MLQHPSLDYSVFQRLASARGFPTAWDRLEALEREADAWVLALREGRRHEAASRGALPRALEWFDRTFRTDESEYLDRPDFPEARKLEIVRSLHKFNRVVLGYRRFAGVLGPWVREVAAREGRPARVLELASGAGEFTLSLSVAARDLGWPIEVTGSDIVPGYVTSANAHAEARGLGARFLRVDALDMQALEPGAYDLIFIAQSLHHFSAGQLARMIAESRRIAGTAFIGVDGLRSILLLGIVPLAAAVTLNRAYFHDAWVTARKFYSATELELVTRLAVPDAGVQVYAAWPGYQVVTARFARGADGGPTPAGPRASFRSA